MYIDGFEGKEDILEHFNVPKDTLDNASVYFAKYSQGSYDGCAFILFEKDGKLYEVNGGHCSCHGLEGQWEPEETSFEALQYRWRSELPSFCESETDKDNLLRVILGAIFEKEVFN